jgi:hypothetical protein
MARCGEALSQTGQKVHKPPRSILSGSVASWPPYTSLLSVRERRRYATPTAGSRWWPGGIDGPVEVTPTAADSNICFVDPPRFVGRLELTTQPLGQLRTVTLPPALDVVCPPQARARRTALPSRSLVSSRIIPQAVRLCARRQHIAPYHSREHTPLGRKHPS